MKLDGSKMKKIRDSLNQKINSGHYYPANVLIGFFEKLFMWGSAPRPRKPCKGLKERFN